MSVRLFNEMSKEEKVDFFQKCQNMLVKNQPSSVWVLRDGDESNRSYFLDLFLKYQGIAYESENIILLFNKHRYTNKDEIVMKSRDRLFSAPDENPNTYSIDFVTSKLTQKILQEVEPHFKDPGIQWIHFLRGQKVSVFDIEPFKKGLMDEFYH